MKIAGCGIGIIGSVALALGLGWFGLYLMLGPSLWKTVIGEVEADVGKLCIGRAYDGDISYTYYARVQGADDVLQEWKYIDWSLDPTRHSETAVTSDSRFAAIAFVAEEGEAIVIYDSDSQELWWNADDQWKSRSKFFRAWRNLHSQNPRLPTPPY